MNVDVVLAIERRALEDQADNELGPWSTGEKLAVCLVLDRYDWLQAMGYSMLEAVDRLGEDWLAAAQQVRRRIR